MKRTLVIALLIIAGLLAFTNPDEVQYRAYIQQREGIVGVLGMGLMDLLSTSGNKGIHQANYIVFSKFYVGGDGLLPRQDLAWGIAGKFIDIQPDKK